MLVDPDAPRLELRCQLVGLVLVVRPDRATKAIWRGIGSCNRIVRIGILDDGKNGTELLFIDETRTIRDVANDGGADEVALLVRRLATYAKGLGGGVPVFILSKFVRVRPPSGV